MTLRYLKNTLLLLQIPLLVFSMIINLTALNDAKWSMYLLIVPLIISWFLLLCYTILSKVKAIE